jgi:hypothetical protein
VGAITSLILGATAIGAGIWGISQATKQAKRTTAPAARAAAPMPEAPKPEAAATQAAEAARSKKRAIQRSRTIYTSPLGIGGEAEVARKFLLGR